ncbi:MAG TPA: hypothetical protein PLF32_02425 [Bacteroidales bacterium]|nr:hypothetical protein [Bacteroidales bacterium]HOR81496.1 hypothetical protein [Bacteroidales bacterium]HPJ90671.1 hypothetical protein [Bacteroidales bacterium]
MKIFDRKYNVLSIPTRFVLSILFWSSLLAIPGIWLIDLSVLYAVSVSFTLILLSEIWTTYTPVELIIIDEEKQKINITYYLFYFFKKETAISFESLNYLAINTSKLMCSIDLLFYKDKKLKVKISNVFGWRKNQIIEIFDYLHIIKAPSDKNMLGFFMLRFKQKSKS